MVRSLLACTIALTLSAQSSRAETYAQAVKAADDARTELGETWNKTRTRDVLRGRVEKRIISIVYGLADHWLGTTWGLGAPQTSEPGSGKINCGTFVGTVLRDSGFNVDVRKLQRQPSQKIIESFVGGKRVRKYSNASMKKFLASVREMGPGLFIIGLDFHVGFLIQTEDDLRFVHASYVTETVVDESAASAEPIVTSKYRVVGKLLSADNIDDWIDGDRIKVKGKW